MNSKKLYYVLLGVTLLIGIMSIASVFFGSKLLVSKSGRLHELKMENEVLDRKKQDVAMARISIEKYQELEGIAKQIVPQDKDQAKTVREIVRFAEKSGINIKSISFPSSTLGQKTTSKDKKTSTGLSQLSPVAGMTGVYEMQLTIQNEPGSADFNKLIRFLKELESNRRTSQVSNLIITPDGENPNQLSFNMAIKVYIKP